MTLRNFTLGMICCLVSVAMSARAGGPPPSGSPTVCNPGVCNISVTVDTSQNPCTVSVDQPFVSSEVSRNLTWTIVTNGYSFAENGIVFEDPQFKPRAAPGADKFIIHNEFTSKGDFPYSVNVQGCAMLDPYVRN